MEDLPNVHRLHQVMLDLLLVQLQTEVILVEAKVDMKLLANQSDMEPYQHLGQLRLMEVDLLDQLAVT